ncbi:MAG: prepilin-type N-terminal cleavage/methylation domain-containing protein [bacterium]
MKKDNFKSDKWFTRLVDFGDAISSRTKGASPKLTTGFTLIETMVAVFILTLALSSLLTLTSSSVFSARYAKNEISASYLLREIADYVRNDRDNVAFHINAGGVGWVTFLNKYGYGNGSSTSCFLANGCYFEPANISFNPPTICPAGVCPTLNYDEDATFNDFYTYRTPAVVVTSPFKRKINMKINSTNSDELDVTVTVSWDNGGLPISRVLRFSLLNWQKSS